MKFKKYLELNESPLYNPKMDSSTGKTNFSKQAQIYIGDVLPEKPLFKNYRYGIKPNAFVVFSDDTPIFYIIYESTRDSMLINNIENISDVKELQFKILSAILNLKLFKFIYTGDILSINNINSHKKYIDKNFNLYISDTKELVTKHNFDDIIKTNDINTQFILSNTPVNEIYMKMYDTSKVGLERTTTIDEIVDPIISTVDDEWETEFYKNNPIINEFMYINESLIYTLQNLDDIDLDMYTQKGKDYYLNDELIFSFNKNKLTVMKRGWQLMNVKRGF